MRKLLVLLAAVAVVALLALQCGAAPSPQVVEREVVVEKKVIETVVVEKEVAVGVVLDPYEPVDFLFTASFDAELKDTLEGLEDPRCSENGFFGRRYCVGEVPGVPGLKAAAVVLGTQPPAATEASTRLWYHFPPRNGERHLLITHGGIAGGFNEQFVEGAPDMQPGDSLAAAGACGTNSNIFQPFLTQGYVIAGPGDTFDRLAEKYAGDSAKGRELFDYNAERLKLTDPADLREGYVLLTPDWWPANTVTSFGIPYGGSIFSQGKRYRFAPENPCVYLSPDALNLRDEVLNRMTVPSLSEEVVEYRQRNFSDARKVVTVFSGDWNEAAGWSWYGDPWIGRHLQKLYHAAQGDMETFSFLAGVFSNWPGRAVVEPDSGYLERAEVDNVLIYRTSSDPPDMYRGQAFSIEDFLANPREVYADVRTAYRGEVGAEDQIPFPALIGNQSAQFWEFNKTAAEIVAERAQ